MATKDAPATAAAPAKRPERPYYWDIPNIQDEDSYSNKKRRPPEIALHNEDRCTGCQGCVPWCPVNCIESLPEISIMMKWPANDRKTRASRTREMIVIRAPRYQSVGR